MTAPWTQPIGGVADTLAARLAAEIPVINTDRLRLRAPKIGDAAIFDAIIRSDRWPHAPGDEMSEEGAWLDFLQMVAGWLLRGTGVLTITDRATGEVYGFVMLNHEFGDAELELGWALTAAAEGRGIATEAARALRDWAASDLRLTGLVSYVDPANAASARVAERLGAVPAGMDHGCTVYRHPAGGAA